MKTFSVGSTGISLNSNVFSPTIVARGTRSNERVGRKILLKQITILGYIYTDFNAPSLLADVWNNIRYGLAVVPTGYGTYNTESLYPFMWDSVSGGLQDPHLYLRNLNETKRLKMVTDRKTRVMMSFYSNTTNIIGAYQSNWLRMVKIKKKLNMEVEWTEADTGGQLENIVKNYLFFWFYSDSTSVPHPTIRFNVRIKFLDT